MTAVSQIDMIVPIEGNAAQAAAILVAFEDWYADHKREIPWLHCEGMLGDDAPELGVLHFGRLEPRPGLPTEPLRDRLTRCRA